MSGFDQLAGNAAIALSLVASSLVASFVVIFWRTSQLDFVFFRIH